MGLRSWLRESFKPAKPASKVVDGDTGQNEDNGGGDSWRSRKIYAPGHRRLVESILGFSNPDEGTDFDDRFFVALEKASAVDLPPQQQRQIQRLSGLLRFKNVRAYAAIELIKDFVLGDGIKFTAEDSKVQEVLNEHWMLNEWEDRGPEKLRALSTWGEQLYPTFGNSKTGILRLSSVLPLRILRVNRNPEDAEEQISITASVGGEQAPSAPEVTGTTFDQIKTQDFQLIRRGDDLKLQFEPGGEWAFFFAINRLAGATRGLPDLMSSIDWLEGMDGAIFSLMERLQIAQDIVWDITYTDLTEEEVQRKVAGFIGALRSGGVYGHNDKIELKVQSPNLGASEAADAIKVLEAQINAGTRFPGLFFGAGADLTRSSAMELSIPVAKMIQSKQNFFRRMISRIFDLQIQYAQSVGRLDKSVDKSYFIEMPQAFLRDTKTISSSLVSLASALTSAERQEWISKEQAATVYQMALQQLGSAGKTVSSSDHMVEVLMGAENLKEAVSQIMKEVEDVGRGKERTPSSIRDHETVGTA